jgi:hypothetical protein
MQRGGVSVCGTFANTNNSGPFTADYVAPAMVPPSGHVSVTAVSVTDNTKSAIATVTISAVSFTSHNYLVGKPKDSAAAVRRGSGFEQRHFSLLAETASL